MAFRDDSGGPHGEEIQARRPCELEFRDRPSSRVIIRKVVSDVRVKGYVHRHPATKEEPQYFIKGAKPIISRFTKLPRLS